MARKRKLRKRMVVALQADRRSIPDLTDNLDRWTGIPKAFIYRFPIIFLIMFFATKNNLEK